MDTTWNPTRGCSSVSSGCDHCYAEAFARRWRGLPGHAYEEGFDVRLVPEKLLEPLRWTRPRTVFVGSMSDLLHEKVPAGYLQEVLEVMKAADWHRFVVLTKRSSRLKKLLSSKRRRAFAELEHVWFGVSVEDRRHGLPRLERLRETPVAKRVVAFEPLLEDLGELDLTGIDWVIVGGETGWGARPLELKWVRSIRRQCRKARVPFTFKGWGAVKRSEEERELDGRVYDERPKRKVGEVPGRRERERRVEEVRKRMGDTAPT